MSTTMRVFIIGLFAAAVWLIFSIQLVIVTILWASPVALPLVALVFYSSLSKFAQKAFRQRLWRSKGLIVAATVAAAIVTLTTFIASKYGYVMRFTGWGLPDTPWHYVGTLNFLVWLAVLFIFLYQNQTFSLKRANYFEYFVESGGIWAFTSKHNAPANRMVCLTLIVALLAWLHGVPSPTWDLADLRYKGQLAVHDAVQSETAEGLVGVANDVSRNLFGSNIVSHSVTLSTPEPPVIRYDRHWFWIKLLQLLIPCAVVMFILSRRDEAAGFFDWLGNLFSRGDRTSGEISTPVATATAVGETAIEGAKDASSSFAQEVAKEWGAEKMNEVISYGFRKLATALRRNN